MVPDGHNVYAEDGRDVAGGEAPHHWKVLQPS